ncbi:hypothetical protein KJ885_01255 [Patescibacteria group bacterium]|nr:hypothetical protein [Patescibacteria group bacterium]
MTEGLKCAILYQHTEKPSFEVKQEGAMEKYHVRGEGKSKTVGFHLLEHPVPSVAEFLEIVQKEFPGIELDDLEMSSGCEAFFVEFAKFPKK